MILKGYNFNNMKNIWSIIKSAVSSKAPILAKPIIWIVISFQSLHILDEFKKDWSGTDKSLFLYWSQKVSPEHISSWLTASKFGLSILSIFSLVLFFRLVYYFAPKRQYMIFVLYVFFFFIYFFLLSYLYSLEVPFDFSILSLNFNTINDQDFLLAALPYVRTGPLVLFFVCVGFLYYWGIKKDHFRDDVFSLNRKLKGLIALTLYVILITIPYKGYDPIMDLFKSAYRYYKIKSNSTSLSIEEYALMKKTFPLSNLAFTTPNKKPNIMIIMVESFNSYFVEKEDKNGKVFTPNFNKLIKQGLYIDYFYGNSVQSCKGQFATLSSLVPPIYGFAFRHFSGTHYQLLPKVLKDHGYYNLFFQASGNLLADNTKAFLENNHFDHVKSARQFSGDEDKPYIFGWGLQDNRLYHHFFNYYDTTIKGKNKPFFAVLPTIFTHNNTVQIPKKDRYLYPDADESFEYFANVIHLTDRHLPLLFEGLEKRGLLENTIVIITGDHSRSAISGSKVSFNQTGFNSDIFQVPFLMIWKGVIPEMRISNIAHSQMDIAPTLLDTLQLSVPHHHFQGKSMLSNISDNDVYLVQPYGGVYLSIINHPYKYGKHLETGREFLFNIVDDPYDSNNIIKNNDQVHQSLADKLNHIYHTNTLIESNRVWMKKN